MAGRIGLSGLDGNCSGRSAECLLGPGCSMVPRRFQRLATPNVEHLSGARLRAQRAFDHGGIGAAIAPDFLQVPTKLPLSAHCSKRAPIVEGYSPENDVMNALPDCGDYVSSDNRWSIHEEAVQVGVHRGTMPRCVVRSHSQPHSPSAPSASSTPMRSAFPARGCSGN